MRRPAGPAADICPRRARGAPASFSGMSELHVVHEGARDAPPLLLLHGSGASGASWRPMVAALAARHHVIVVDLPGCGQSPPAPSYAVPAQAGQVAALLDGLGLRRLAVAGHSSGGYVATALAEQRADLVRSITLISCGPSLDALLPQPLILRALLSPPLGPLLWSRRSDAMIRKGSARRPCARSTSPTTWSRTCAAPDTGRSARCCGATPSTSPPAVCRSGSPRCGSRCW
ncbi:hypothetical protein GCM10027610_049850 [Dactylosporangium cerinum]